jgi:hypothetical protein
MKTEKAGGVFGSLISNPIVNLKDKGFLEVEKRLVW